MNPRLNSAITGPLDLTRNIRSGLKLSACTWSQEPPSSTRRMPSSRRESTLHIYVLKGGRLSCRLEIETQVLTTTTSGERPRERLLWPSCGQATLVSWYHSRRLCVHPVRVLELLTKNLPGMTLHLLRMADTLTREMKEPFLGSRRAQ